MQSSFSISNLFCFRLFCEGKKLGQRGLGRIDAFYSKRRRRRRRRRWVLGATY